MSLRISSRAAVIAACLAAASFAASFAWAQGASVESATEEQKKTAQQNFEKGMAAQKKGRHDEALTAFKASYDAVASPNSHLMVARALMELGRLEEAYVEYEKTVAEAEAAASGDKKYEQTAKAASNEFKDVRSKVALLTVNVTSTGAGDRVTVRGRELERSQWGKPLPVMPGSVRVELTTSTGQEVGQDVEAEAGGSPDVTLAAPAAGGPTTSEEPGETSSASAKLDSSTSTRTWAYVAGGVGVAGFITFGVFGILNNSKHSKLEDECSGGVCPKDLEEDRDQGQMYQTIANIGLGVGIVGVAAGTVLFLMSGSDEKAARLERKRPSAPRVDVGVGPRWVTVNGTF